VPTTNNHQPSTIIHQPTTNNQEINMLELIVVWIVTTVSLLIISRIAFFGVTIRSFTTALIVALVLGLLNALLTPILSFIAFIPMILTFGLFSVVINAFVFWLAARLVPGFELERGCLSALLGPVVLSLLNSIILWLLGVGQS
jgi:putative membrane protein